MYIKNFLFGVCITLVVFALGCCVWFGINGIPSHEYKIARVNDGENTITISCKEVRFYPSAIQIDDYQGRTYETYKENVVLLKVVEE